METAVKLARNKSIIGASDLPDSEEIVETSDSQTKLRAAGVKVARILRVTSQHKGLMEDVSTTNF